MCGLLCAIIVFVMFVYGWVVLCLFVVYVCVLCDRGVSCVCNTLCLRFVVC